MELYKFLNTDRSVTGGSAVVIGDRVFEYDEKVLELRPIMVGNVMMRGWKEAFKDLSAPILENFLIRDKD